MAVRAKWEGRDKVMARLRSVAPKAEIQMAVAQLEAANELANAIRGRAPVRTGRYRDSIRGGRLGEAQGKLRAVGTNPTKDPNATGIFALFIWKFLEFGTRTGTSARPHIFPTYRAMKKQIRRKIANVVNRAVKAVNG